MDWIERLFHLRPDGGDGSFELLIEAVGALLVLRWVARRAVNGLKRARAADGRVEPTHHQARP
jgi:hypothetical protein